MASIDDIETDEASLKDGTVQLIHLAGALLAELQALGSNPGVPADVQAKIDDLHVKFHNDLADITSAISADGTPINPAPVDNLPTPFITGIDPTSGNVGDSVTITGKAFTGAESVDFGGSAVASTDFSVPNDTTIVAKVPAGGSGRVTVTTAQGTSNAGAFAYNGQNGQPANQPLPGQPGGP